MTKPPGIAARNTSQWSIPALTQTLGYSGVLPFISLAIAIALQPQQKIWQQLMAGYTLAILCFLLGAWWAIALLRRFKLPLILSNLVVIATVFGFILLPTAYFYLLAAAVFIGAHGVRTPASTVLKTTRLLRDHESSIERYCR